MGWDGEARIEKGVGVEGRAIDGRWKKWGGVSGS